MPMDGGIMFSHDTARLPARGGSASPVCSRDLAWLGGPRLPTADPASSLMRRRRGHGRFECAEHGLRAPGKLTELPPSFVDPALNSCCSGRAAGRWTGQMADGVPRIHRQVGAAWDAGSVVENHHSKRRSLIARGSASGPASSAAADFDGRVRSAELRSGNSHNRRAPA